MEKTYVMIKPDAVQRNLVGKIIARFEQKGYKLVAAKLMTISESLAKKHYAEHDGKPFFKDLVSFITSGPVFAMVWEGDNVIEVSRKMMGKTNPQEAAVGTIRGDYGIVTHRNIIHGSDSVESAEREINLFFTQEELQNYSKNIDDWLS
ncbi:nucleoside-diphosphate kinase [Gracilibacillus kekensis]|uniref:Nucleoside diphosphate kinase n=1 Tax=Gracilibacillus kekensis TaxID=1027249 RepID=A0A1M7PQJ7_9BACI|nr:nucleoside-diphosphate kinase [Gracilibacillus kekensis]SHN19607.1 nucleoside diphosphate kinase [Gracilibacillus kekensis]